MARRIIPKSKISAVKIDSVQRSKITDTRNMKILYECSRYWDNLRKFRDERTRNKRYLYGDQWSDKVEFEGKTITEEEYIIKQGSVPLKNNLIRRLVRNTTGVYRQQAKEPVCVARDRDEQELGEIMSTTLQYNHQLNKLNEIDARSFEEFLISGFISQKEFYGWMNDKFECWTNYVSPNNIFFDNAMRDMRHWDLSVIGEIHDLSFQDVCQSFAHNQEDYTRLLNIYKTARNSDYVFGQYNEFGYYRDGQLSFLVPQDLSLCRVFEIWKKEQKARFRCHDYLNGEYYKIELSQKDSIDAENSSRIVEGASQGIPADDIPLIELEWFVDSYWYYRFLSPVGDILSEGETPYMHKTHPYIIKAYPFIDGEIHSFVADVIDQQRYINRMITLNDLVIRVGAKGVLMVPDDCVPDHMTPESFAEAYSRADGVLFFKAKPGVEIPHQISKNLTNIGTHEMLAMQMKLMEDISGVHGALQGKTASSGTSGTLYAQQVQNSVTSLVDILESFGSFTTDRSMKKLKNIQQFYDSKRRMNISGARSKIVVYDPDKIKDIEFDISVIESTSTPAYRMLANDFLMQIWSRDQINLVQLLENGNFPFADSLLQSIKSEQERLQKGEQDNFSPEVQQQVQQGVDPEKMKLINKILQQ